MYLISMGKTLLATPITATLPKVEIGQTLGLFCCSIPNTVFIEIHIIKYISITFMNFILILGLMMTYTEIRSFNFFFMKMSPPRQLIGTPLLIGTAEYGTYLNPKAITKHTILIIFPLI